MTAKVSISRPIAASVVAVTLAAVTAAAAMMFPERVSSDALGPDWQCTRIAFVFTSCSQVARFKTAAAEAAGKAPACPRQGWHGVLRLLR